jgi:hypothetical protein
MPLTQVQPGMLGTPQFYGFKNRIINGDMGIWQRGTSFSNPSVGGSFYTADRWGVNRAGDLSGATVSRSTDVPSGFQYSLKLQRTAGNTSTAGLYLFNSNESVNTLDLAGQAVTISFWVKAGANYSGGALSVIGLSGTGTDQRVYAYTGATAFINATQAITSTWTRYSFTATVASNATEVGFQFFWTPTGTAGADDSIYITGIQLELGVSPTSFDFLSIGTELQLCQRYYYKINSTTNAYGMLIPVAYVLGGTTLNVVIMIPVPMRIAISSIESASTTWRIAGGTITSLSNYVVDTATSTTQSALASATLASSQTAGAMGSIIQNNSTSGFIAVSAEI